MLFKVLLAFLLRRLVFIKYMEGIIIFIFRVDPIPRETPAKAVGALMHDGDGIDDELAGKASARF